MSLKEFIEEIRKQMRMRNIKAEEMATVCHMSLKTWYRNMNNSEMFRVGELERMSRYVGMKISYERKSK